MSKSLIKLFIDFQKWMLVHMKQLYLWIIISGVISYGIAAYKHIHNIPIISEIFLYLFCFYATFKLIIND
jgi:hypothetical protein